MSTETELRQLEATLKSGPVIERRQAITDAAALLDSRRCDAYCRRQVSALLEWVVANESYTTVRERAQTVLDNVAGGTPLLDATEHSSGGPAQGLSPEQQEVVVANTVGVLTTMPERRDGWRQAIAGVLEQAEANDDQALAAFSRALLALLDGEAIEFDAENAYVELWRRIESGVVQGGPPPSAGSGQAADEPEPADIDEGLIAAIRAFVDAKDWAATRQVVEREQALLLDPAVESIFEDNIRQARSGGDERAATFLQQHLDLLRACKRDGVEAVFDALEEAQPSLPFDEALIGEIITALRGAPQEKLALVQTLTGLRAEHGEDKTLVLFVDTVQAALVGADPATLGGDLTGIYAQIWQGIAAVATGTGAQLNEEAAQAIVANTLAVLGPASDRRSEWRTALGQARNAATVDGDAQLVALVDAILALLDAEGDASGIDMALNGVYGEIWEEIVAGLRDGDVG